MLQPPGPSVRFKSNFPESLKLYGPNDPAEVLLYRKTRRGWNETLSQGYATAGPSAGPAALMSGINLRRCRFLFCIFLFYDKVNYDFDNGWSDSRAASAWEADSQKVAGVIGESQLYFTIHRDPGRGSATMKTLRKERAVENKWEQFVSTKVFTTVIYYLVLS